MPLRISLNMQSLHPMPVLFHTHLQRVPHLDTEGVGVAGGQAIHAVVAEADAQLTKRLGLGLLPALLQVAVVPVWQVLQ